jgi:hypothetical protein
MLMRVVGLGVEIKEGVRAVRAARARETSRKRSLRRLEATRNYAGVDASRNSACKQKGNH